VHVNRARLNTRGLSVRAGCSCGLALIFFLIGAKSLENAVAEGDTRTISMHHLHTGEDITITYKRNGQYDEAALQKLNWFLRDWRRGEQTRMDPHLIDLVWEVQREANTDQPIQVVCGYRAPQTNAMLRRRSSGVARFSQHMLGHAMDFSIPGIPLEQLREIGLRLQRGGVGFYPTSGSPFVHMDTAGIRMWPRMTREELSRVFPDGRTVHIPTDGRPLAGYALALADIQKRGGSLPSANSLDAARAAGVYVDLLVASNDRPHANPFAALLGLASKDEDDEDDVDVTPVAAASAPAATLAVAQAPMPPKHPVLAAITHDAKVGAQIAEKTTAAVAIKVADAASKVKLIRTADAAPLQPPQPAQPAPPAAGATASATPTVSPLASAQPPVSQVIAARGFWEGPADGTIVANPKPQRAAPASTPARKAATDSSSSEATGAIGPFTNPSSDPSTPGLLAYAEPGPAAAAQAMPAPSAAPMGIAALRAAAMPAQQAAVSAAPASPPVASDTTVAVKRAANQPTSVIMTASSSSVTVVKSGAHFENPWLRAIVLSPSVHQFLTTVALGARDFRSLASLMVKPASAVMMTFAADPNPGLAHDHFSGAAIVFVSTVNYPARTALLR
jgi:uncharacterized protein YcbK (DUF882 family)